MVEDQGIAADGARWLKKVEAITLAELAERGEVTGTELSKAIPDLRRQLSASAKARRGPARWASRPGCCFFSPPSSASCGAGRRGAWTSSQYRWSLMETWLPDGVAARSTPTAARAELVRRWLATYGPATAHDVKWWTGWTVAQTRAALASIGAVEVDLEQGTGWVLPGDDGPVRAPAPWVALLPALDPTTMGWNAREWYLGDHGNALFDRNGNAGPTIWVDGRIVGAWTQRASGEVVYQVLEDVGQEAAAAIDRAAGALTEWLGAVRVTPRFPTPLQRALATA